MRKLIRFSVDHPISVLMFVLAVLLLGYISFSKLGIDLFPDLNNPRLFIEITAGERPPEEIENQYVDPIESLSIRQRNVIEVSSISQVGSAQITVEYTWDADMDEAFLELQKVMTTFSQNSDLDDLKISQYNPNAAPIMVIGFSHEQHQEMDELRKIAENYIRNELIRLEGIADIELSGHEEKEVLIETDTYLLEAYQLSPESIVSQIKNFNRNVSGGSIVEMGIQYIVKGVSIFESLQDIENLIIAYKQSDGSVSDVEETTFEDPIPVFLKDVAHVSFRNKDPENIVRINQERCIGLAVYKETKFNTVNAVKSLVTALEDIKRTMPGYRFTIIQNQGEFISRAVNEVKQTALIGIVLAIMILYIFLRRIGATAIISIAIPISVVATFNLMYFNGLTLNIMTLGGLALGAGMLVDNAIVVMESIFRNVESGLSIKEASVIGTEQVGGAITASTITTIIVFLPIVYLHGASGELFKDQAWTVAFSLFSSLVVAVLVIPMLCTRFLKPSHVKKPDRTIKFFWYSAFLSRILKRKAWVLGGAAILIAAAVLIVPIVGSEFIPRTESNQFTMELKLPEGTELKRTETVADNIEMMIQKLFKEELGTIYSHIGTAAGMSVDEQSIFKNENSASITVVLNRDHSSSLNLIISRLDRALSEIPGLEVQFIREQTAMQSTLGTESAPIVVEVKGDELGEIERLTEQVKKRMLGIDNLFNIRSSFEEGAPEIEVTIDRLKAGMYGIGVDNITSQIRDQLMGKSAGQWEYEGEMKDITLRLPDVEIGQFMDMTLRNGIEIIRLDEIARIRKSSAPREILRRNQIRIGKITSDYIKDKPFDRVVSNINESLKQIDFPPDYSVEITGEEQKRKDALANLSFALILSIILVYMVLASQFESLVHPFTILLTIPLAGVGAVLMFFILGRSLNMMAYIGMIMLAGIAVNDSIILVDAINQLKNKGLERQKAIIEAGQRRVRPIIMTSLTTILALLPLCFGFGEGAALRSPMALAVIGGLVTSTLLTLMVIPCVYSIIDQLREKMTFRRKEIVR